MNARIMKSTRRWIPLLLFSYRLMYQVVRWYLQHVFSDHYHLYDQFHQQDHTENRRYIHSSHKRSNIYHCCNQISQFFLIDLSIIRNIISTLQNKIDSVRKEEYITDQMHMPNDRPNRLDLRLKWREEIHRN